MLLEIFVWKFFVPRLAQIHLKLQKKALHCVKSIRNGGYSSLHFAAFRLNNSEYGHFLRSVRVVDILVLRMLEIV